MHILLNDERRKKQKHSNDAAPLLAFNFYLLHLVFVALHFISLALHRRRHRGVDEIVATALHTLAVFAVVTVTLRMPLSPAATSSRPSHYAAVPTTEPVDGAQEGDGRPGHLEDSKDKVVLASPEPHVTLFEWIVFSWIGPLIEKGRRKKLGYGDVWQLPFEMSSEGIRETSPGKRLVHNRHHLSSSRGF